MQSSTNPGRNLSPAAPPVMRTASASRPGPGHQSHPTPIPPHYAMPVVAAPSLPLMPLAGIQTFDQWLSANPVWTQQAAASANQRGSLQAHAGWYRDSAGNLVPAANAAPDSLYSQLGTSLAANKAHAAQNAANAGALFSGGTATDLEKATQAYEAGVAKAQGDLVSQLGGVDQSDVSTKLDLAPNYQDAVKDIKTKDVGAVISEYGHLRPEQRGPAVDAYLKAYGKYLTPAQTEALTRIKAGAQHEYDAYRVRLDATHARNRARLEARRARQRKRRAPTTSHGNSKTTGGLAGGDV